MTSSYRRPVPASRELARIAALPSRTWDVSDRRLADFAARLSEHLRTPGGTMMLFPEQAQALYEISVYGGSFAPLQVSKGKTLISLLAPVVRPRIVRPMLITLANLIDKTEAEARMYAHHFRIARNLTIRSYTILSRTKGRDILATERPDMIISDEAHKLKNPRAGVTKKLEEYLAANPRTEYVDLTGTAWTTSLKECAHRLRWALGRQGSPVPVTYHDLEEWCDVLDTGDDEQANPLDPDQVGALRTFVAPEDGVRQVEDEHGNRRAPDLRTIVRRGFSRRFFSTPGVVGTQGENAIGASLQLRCLALEPPPNVREALTKLDAEWMTPDGYTFKEATAKWSFQRTLSLGFYHRREPWPPKDWIEARRIYASTVRYLVKENRSGYHTPQEIVFAVTLRGEYVDTQFTTGRGELVRVGDAFEAWAKIKPTFTYRTVPTWLSDHALLAIRAWADRGPGVIWIEDADVGKELARQFGFPLYASEGREALTGTPIRDERGDRTIVASRQSNATGQNLQMFDRMLLTNLYPRGDVTEQQIARIHRRGQKKPIVYCDILMAGDGHRAALERVFVHARAAEASLGQRQKVLFGDWVREEDERS